MHFYLSPLGKQQDGGHSESSDRVLGDPRCHCFSLEAFVRGHYRPSLFASSYLAFGRKAFHSHSPGACFFPFAISSTTPENGCRGLGGSKGHDLTILPSLFNGPRKTKILCGIATLFLSKDDHQCCNNPKKCADKGK